MLSFLLCVVMIMCMIPTTLFAANSMTVEMGNGSIITISANKDINNITLPTDRKYGGVDVDFVITSDKTPIKSIEIGDCTWPLSGNRVEYSHHFTSTNADDSYFDYAESFLNNAISVEQLARAMKLGKLGEQIVIKSKFAFSKLKYEGYDIANKDRYYVFRKDRNDEANKLYSKFYK